MVKSRGCFSYLDAFFLGTGEEMTLFIYLFLTQRDLLSLSVRFH